MKRIPFVLLTICLIFVASCAENDMEAALINAENYDGLAFWDERNSVNGINEPLEIPVVVGTAPITAEEQKPDNPDNSNDPASDNQPPETDIETTLSQNVENEPFTPPDLPETKPETKSETKPKTNPETKPAPEPEPEPEPLPNPITATFNYSEVKGVWISYIELSGILTGKTEEQFRAGYRKMMENCASLGINTVYVHLRPFGDALYKSALFPWSKYAASKIGSAPAFDPLVVMLEEAHRLKISFHGWINPLRVCSAADIESVSADFPVGKWYRDADKKGKYLVRNGDYWYLNPAYGEVINLIADGAAEICANYKVDGLHIDDYFYPTTESGFDQAAFSESGYASRDEFRLYNINVMVKKLYASVKDNSPNALFGISPQGNIKNNYTNLYADVEKWCKNMGFCDYIAPQIYYGFDNSTQPYAECVAEWQEMLKNSSVKLIVGLAVYKIGKEDIWAGGGINEWVEKTAIIKRQIEFAKKQANYGGVIFYSYNYLFNPVHLTDKIKAEIEAFKPLLGG